MTSLSVDTTTVRDQIAELPADWHTAGTVGPRVLQALELHAPRGGFTVETGTGKTTLLLSHLSRHHVVFAVDDLGGTNTLNSVQTSALLNPETVEFVVGPSQRHLPQYVFKQPVDMAFLDGPHAFPFPELEYWVVYPHIPSGGMLVLDDIHIRTIGRMFQTLRADAMWDLVEIADTTAFFRRTAAPMLDPFGEGWWLQGANARQWLGYLPAHRRPVARLKLVTPTPVKNAAKRLLDRRARS